MSYEDVSRISVCLLIGLYLGTIPTTTIATSTEGTTNVSTTDGSNTGGTITSGPTTQTATSPSVDTPTSSISQSSAGDVITVTPTTTPISSTCTDVSIGSAVELTEMGFENRSCIVITSIVVNKKLRIMITELDLGEGWISAGVGDPRTPDPVEGYFHTNGTKILGLTFVSGEDEPVWVVVEGNSVFPYDSSVMIYVEPTDDEPTDPLPVVECGELGITNTSGQIGIGASFGEQYQNNQHCVWTFDGPTGTVFQIWGDEFETEADYDFLRVGQGVDPDDSESVYILSGVHVDVVFTVRSTKVWVKFDSDISITKQGFLLNYGHFDISNSCGKAFHYEGGDPIEITSPVVGESEGYYECEWWIFTPTGTKLAITVSDIFLQGTGNMLTIDNPSEAGHFDTKKVYNSDTTTITDISLVTCSNTINIGYIDNGIFDGNFFNLSFHLSDAEPTIYNDVSGGLFTLRADNIDISELTASGLPLLITTIVDLMNENCVRKSCNDLYLENEISRENVIVTCATSTGPDTNTVTLFIRESSSPTARGVLVTSSALKIFLEDHRDEFDKVLPFKMKFVDEVETVVIYKNAWFWSLCAAIGFIILTLSGAGCQIFISARKLSGKIDDEEDVIDYVDTGGPWRKRTISAAPTLKHHSSFINPAFEDTEPKVLFNAEAEKAEIVPTESFTNDASDHTCMGDAGTPSTSGHTPSPDNLPRAHEISGNDSLENSEEESSEL